MWRNFKYFLKFLDISLLDFVSELVSALKMAARLLLLLLLLLLSSSSSSSSLTSFMHGIYNYVTETNHVSRVYIVTAVLYLQFILHTILSRCEICSVLLHQHFPQYMRSANMAVFCSSLILCFPSMLLRHCLSDFEMVPVAPIITANTFVFTFHMH